MKKNQKKKKKKKKKTPATKTYPAINKKEDEKTPSHPAANPAAIAFIQFPFSASRAISLYIPEPSFINKILSFASYEKTLYLSMVKADFI